MRSLLRLKTGENHQPLGVILTPMPHLHFTYFSVSLPTLLNLRHTLVYLFVITHVLLSMAVWNLALELLLQAECRCFSLMPV